LANNLSSGLDCNLGSGPDQGVQNLPGKICLRAEIFAAWVGRFCQIQIKEKDGEETSPSVGE
jgi:hypothetical protein